MSGAPCPLCGSRRIVRGWSGHGHCVACGHRFARTVGGALTPGEIYDEGYFRGTVYRDYLGEARWRTAAFADKLRLVDPLLPNAGKVLDVGCATGYFLALMRERGFQTRGVEVSQFAARHARQTVGMDVHVGELPQAGLPSASFDLVSFWDTLEHLPDPVSYLREAHRLLKDSGALLVETLNVATLSRLLLRKRWPLFAPPYHLQYFSRRSLTALLKREGFRVLRAIPIQTYVGISGRVRVWRYYPSPLLRTLIGAVAGDVILYAAVKGAG